MAAQWKQKDKKVYEDWIKQIGDNTEKLNDWENSFVESVSDQLDRKGFISEKQEEILERIYCKV